MPAKCNAIRSILADKDLLIILDDAHSSTDLRPVFRAIGNHPVIVTTRDRALDALIDGRIMEVRLNKNDALDLITEVVGRPLSEAECGAAEEICQLTGYHTKNIKLTAHKAKSYGLSLVALSQEMTRRSLSLRRSGKEGPARIDTSLRAPLDVIFSDLTDEQRLFFTSLSAFEGLEFTSDAAACVAGVEPSKAEELIEGLCKISLLEPRRADRWSLHPLIQDYVVEALGRSELAAQRMILYYRRLVTQANEGLHDPATRDKSLFLLDDELSNIRNVFGQCLARETGDAVWELMANLSWYWAVRGYHSEGRTCYNLAKHLTTYSLDRARALDGVALLAANQSDFQEAAILLRKAVLHYWRARDRRGLAGALNRLGGVHWVRGHHARAYRLCKIALAQWKRLPGEVEGLGTTLNYLGLIEGQRGNWDEASRLFAESFRIRWAIGDKIGLAVCLNNWGEVQRCAGRFQQAETLYYSSLDLCKEANYKWNQSNVLNNIGELLRHNGCLDDARGCYQDGLRIALDFTNNLAVATALAGLAGIAVLQGQFYEAARLYGAAEALTEQSGGRLGPANQADYQELYERFSSMSDGTIVSAWEEGYRRPARVYSFAIAG